MHLCTTSNIQGVYLCRGASQTGTTHEYVWSCLHLLVRLVNGYLIREYTCTCLAIFVICCPDIRRLHNYIRKGVHAYYIPPVYDVHTMER